MVKGTPSMGKRNKLTHIRCRRCGRHAYHIRKKACASCGWPSPGLRDFAWQWKDTLTRARVR